MFTLWPVALSTKFLFRIFDKRRRMMSIRVNWMVVPCRKIPSFLHVIDCNVNNSCRAAINSHFTLQPEKVIVSDKKEKKDLKVNIFE